MSTPGGNTHVVTVEGDASGFAQRVTADSYTFSADEPVAGGGGDRTGSVPAVAGGAWHLQVDGGGTVCTTKAVAADARARAARAFASLVAGLRELSYAAGATR